jgi:hypothetical protein
MIQAMWLIKSTYGYVQAGRQHRKAGKTRTKTLP